jgi:hypothetical protein
MAIILLIQLICQAEPPHYFCNFSIRLGIPLDLLRKIFSKTYIHQEVFREVVEKGKGSGSQLVKEAP